MWQIVEGDLFGIRELLLRPSPTNLVEAVTKLESVAAEVGRMKAVAVHQGVCEPAMAANLRKLQDEMSRIRRMLSSAATFYNGLASLKAASTTGYERTGLLRSAASSGRVLAQL